MKLRIDLNEPQILEKVTNDRFGLHVSNEWKRLINPYTPYDTGKLIGQLGQTVDVQPFRLHYKAEYATFVYDNTRGVQFKTVKSPFATDHWDEKAAKSGQKDKLCRILNTDLKSGQY